MEEYKGIYYGDDSEKKYFEGGAHFKYSKLYHILEQLAIEQKIQQRQKQKELYVHKRNKLSNLSQNNHINCLENFSKQKKSRNFQDFLINNNLTGNSTTNNKNKTYTNTAFIKYNNKKNQNDLANLNNKANYNQTYILINYKNKDNSNNSKNKSFAIKNQKKMIISRNKGTSFACKARPNTILKEGIQNLFMFGKNNLISNSMEPRKKKQNILVDTLNKRSFPNINNIINDKKHVRIKTTDSYLEIKKIGGKTERNKIGEHNEKWNKSQNNFNQIKIKLNNTSIKKTQNKIKKKNFIIGGNKKIQERTKSNLTNNICKNILEKSNRKEQENETKKEIILNKPNKKKNINKKFILPNNTNPSIKTKININNQIKNIIYQPNNITQKLDKKFLNNLSKLSFIDKSRNKTSEINEINNSFFIKSNQNIKSRNNIVLNTSRTKNPDKYKTSFKLMIEKGKIPNMKQNNKLLQPKKNINNKLFSKANKRMNKNAPLNSNNTYDDNKNIKYNLMINNIPINKEKIIENINNNNLTELKNKTLNINIINNTCIYIKPKQSKCGLKHKSRNEQIKSDLKQINYTQRPIMRKKKPLIKIAKK